MRSTLLTILSTIALFAKAQIFPTVEFYPEAKSLQSQKVVEFFEGVVMGFGDQISGSFESCIHDDVTIFK